MSVELPSFASSRIIHWGDLSDDDRERFVNFFVENNISFFKDEDGSYATNVRIYDGNVIDAEAHFGIKNDDEKKGKNGNKGRGGPNSNLDGSATFEFSMFAEFVKQVGNSESVSPKKRPIYWLMHFIDEIYDSRYARDTAELTEADDASKKDKTSSFPTFVVEFFAKRYGLRALIDQNCWDLIYNLNEYRKDNLEVELFARFLEEQYDPDDLLFFLYVRSVVQKELNYSFRARWNEASRSAPLSKDRTSFQNLLQLSFRDCCTVSRVVFGSENDPLYRTFMGMIERNMTGSKTAKGDERTIDSTQFLNLAVVEYHETRPSDEDMAAANEYNNSSSSFENYTSSSSQENADRLYREASAAYDERQRVPTAAGRGINSVRPTPQLLEALGETMHFCNEKYLAIATKPANTLPGEVQTQIRSEVQTQLESTVDSLLAQVIAASQGGNSPSREIETLSIRFSDLVAAGASTNSDSGLSDAVLERIRSFCEAVVSSVEVSKAIDPLVNLLVHYATTRLREAAK